MSDEDTSSASSGGSTYAKDVAAQEHKIAAAEAKKALAKRDKSSADGERRGFSTALTTAKKNLKAKKQELLDRNALVEQKAGLSAVQKAVDSLHKSHPLKHIKEQVEKHEITGEDACDLIEELLEDAAIVLTANLRETSALNTAKQQVTKVDVQHSAALERSRIAEAAELAADKELASLQQELHNLQDPEVSDDESIEDLKSPSGGRSLWAGMTTAPATECHPAPKKRRVSDVHVLGRSA
eukprot:COSAG03_NODE_590_length_6826_cov_1200.670581_2_plen_240_part_00